MKLLLDQNVSRKLVPDLEKLFPGSNHVYLLGLQKASDGRSGVMPVPTAS
jgi:predicted nuclease of predicted toxin-antitoxin system